MIVECSQLLTIRFLPSRERDVVLLLRPILLTNTGNDGPRKL